MSRPAPLLVILWFDTEDYVLHESDGMARRLADMCTELGITACFKLVGEKLRHLQRTGRDDVLEALAKHEIGYHTDFHSRPPAHAVQLQHSGWEDGIAEFTRREQGGLRDVADAFGRGIATYGQPGSSWAPQAFAALRELGVPTYLDESNHLTLNQEPFFYCGQFTVNGMQENFTFMHLEGGDRLQEATDEFSSIAERLTAAGGGVISIPYHPCEWVQTEFWDGTNYTHGVTVHPDELRAAPARPVEETELQLANFRKYLEFMLAVPGVRFVTMGDLAEIYRDTLAGRSFTPAEVREIAGSATADVDAVAFDGGRLSPAEQLNLLVQLASGAAECSAPHIDGPSRRRQPSSGMADPTEVPGWLFAEAVADVADFIAHHAQVPSEVWLGSVSITPEDFLATLAGLLAGGAGAGAWPETVTLVRARLASADAVGENDGRVWDWPIFPEGFRSAQILDQAKLQTWTLKPAVLDAVTAAGN